MDLPKEAKRAPSAPVWNQSFPSPCAINTVTHQVLNKNRTNVKQQHHSPSSHFCISANIADLCSADDSLALLSQAVSTFVDTAEGGVTQCDGKCGVFSRFVVDVASLHSHTVLNTCITKQPNNKQIITSPV